MIPDDSAVKEGSLVAVRAQEHGNLVKVACGKSIAGLTGKELAVDNGDEHDGWVGVVEQAARWEVAAECGFNQRFGAQRAQAVKPTVSSGTPRILGHHGGARFPVRRAWVSGPGTSATLHDRAMEEASGFGGGHQSAD